MKNYIFKSWTFESWHISPLKILWMFGIINPSIFRNYTNGPCELISYTKWTLFCIKTNTKPNPLLLQARLPLQAHSLLLIITRVNPGLTHLPPNLLLHCQTYTNTIIHPTTLSLPHFTNTPPQFSFPP